VPERFRRVPALTNTFSGVAGEARVAAELVRAGFRVAKPLWTDDEADLLVLMRSNRGLLPIVVQVKSVQFLPDAKGKVAPRVFAQGLKKRYLQKFPAFLLALYRVDEDFIYLIPGPENVITTYESQQRFNKKHKAFSTLGDDEDVRIAIDFEDGLLTQWKVNPRDASSVSKAFNGLKDEIEESSLVKQAIDAAWNLQGNAIVVTDDPDDDIEVQTAG
jgi:hypothetical protein